MISDDHLTGWLCFVRLNLTSGHEPVAPGPVIDDMHERGWITQNVRGPGETATGVEVTTKGLAVSDLSAPEWGICSLRPES